MKLKQLIGGVSIVGALGAAALGVGAGSAYAAPGPGGPGPGGHGAPAAPGGDHGAPAGAPGGNHGAPAGAPGGNHGAPAGAPGGNHGAPVGAPGGNHGAPAGGGPGARRAPAPRGSPIPVRARPAVLPTTAARADPVVPADPAGHGVGTLSVATSTGPRGATMRHPGDGARRHGQGGADRSPRPVVAGEVAQSTTGATRKHRSGMPGSISGALTSSECGSRCKEAAVTSPASPLGEAGDVHFACRAPGLRACQLHGMRPTCDLRHVPICPAFNTAGVRLLS